MPIVPLPSAFITSCTAYGSDATRYGDFVEKGYLPKRRSGSCKREYNTTAFAFRGHISPHVDKKLAMQAWARTGCTI